MDCTINSYHGLNEYSEMLIESVLQFMAEGEDPNARQHMGEEEDWGTNRQDFFFFFFFFKPKGEALRKEKKIQKKKK